MVDLEKKKTKWYESRVRRVKSKANETVLLNEKSLYTRLANIPQFVKDREVISFLKV